MPAPVPTSANVVSDCLLTAPAAAVPVAGFVACGFEHCIANMFFIPFGMLTQGAIGLDSVTMAGMVQNIVLATVGNIVGGALMVACAYWFVYGKKAKR